MKISIFKTLLISLTFLTCSQNSSECLTVKTNKETLWWAGIIREGHKMPLQNGYTADLYGQCWRNQLQPLLLSTSGELVWSEEPFRFRMEKDAILFDKIHDSLQYRKAGDDLREAYLYASEHYFPPSGKTPPELFFTAPQYNTWIELTYNQNQEDVLTYARSIIANGMPPGIIMIDDTWQEDYGKWNFHKNRFADPKKMIEELHKLGFKVMVWICPFVSPDSDVYRALEKKGAFLTDDTGKPAMVRWWNGVSAKLDLTHPEGTAWLKSELDGLIKDYEVDGFKLDAGDSRFYTEVNASKDISPNAHTELFAKVGLDYPFNEYRATWKMGGQPLVQRLHDKNHDWKDLEKLIPQMLLEGLMGYPFSCPDMIGGGQYTSFLDGATIDQELVVRSTQVHALMPMMQFSVAPWRVLDEEHFKGVLKVVALREKFKGNILRLAKEAAITGEPIVRSMEYVFPHTGLANVSDQFMLGDSVLVAPFLESGEGIRTVFLPKGEWKADDNKVYKGNREIEVHVPLNRLPYFLRL